ncbi:putative cytochrome P450 [Mycobacterium xenopi 3993]|nr:putative cytochrome P450 [Mycobacterium xenopi 3993]
MREYRGSIIDMDDPEHMRLRKIVSRGFTPRMLSELRGLVEQTTAEILDEMPPSGECDFVSAFATLLPLRIIDSMLGSRASTNSSSCGSAMSFSAPLIRSTCRIRVSPVSRPR